MESNPEEDPGWPLASGTIFTLLIPGMMQRRMRQSSDSLISLRMVFLSFMMAIAFFAVVMIFVVPFAANPNGSAVCIGIIAVYVVVSQLVLRARDEPLNCAMLAGSYRTRFFLRIAIADAGALFGFVGAFITEGSITYYAAVVLSLAGWAYAAPTRGALQRDQQALYEQGCNTSLVAALRGGPYTPMPEG
jgi:hypothetical protein